MSDAENSVTLTTASFDKEVLESKNPVLVDFWAAWCGPCRAIHPIVEELAGEYAGKATVGRVNVDEEPALAQKYGIQGIPSLLFFQDGKLVDQVVGMVPKAHLEAKLSGLVPEG
jgi:thioredoxin 1